MFSFQTNANRLASLTDDVIEEKNKKFSGIVKVSIEDLVFSPEFMPCDQNITAAKVSRLKRIFKTEGCNRREPSNFILGTISASLLSEALLLSKLTLDDLRGSEGSRMLYLPRFQYIKCANGRSRAAALLDTPHLGTWWTVELYLYQDLDPKAFDIITENYINEGAFSHGHICERIVYHRSHNLTEEKRWWARLTKSLGVILRSILKHPLIAPALLELIINIPGMREGFEIGTWHKIIGGKCDEEVVRYMEFTLESWVKLMGSKEALLNVDTEDVKEFQLRVPGVSQVDYRYLADLIEGGIAFKRLTNVEERSQILHRMKNINYLLPSIYTLQKDFKYLRLCTDTMKRLLHGKRKIPLTAQVLAYDAFSHKDPIGPNDVFFERLKSLYLYIMQDLVELTGEWPLLEDGEEPPEAPFRHPTNWHRLAQKARRLGFESDEIRRLAVTNPDEQVASKALQDARPTALYEYDESEVQDILSRIVHEFTRARARASTDIESTFTTIGAGEPITRRCGRQYSGAYMHDRWSFNLDEFSRRTRESRDITSLFVRKSVFHAFWRLDEDKDGDEAMPYPERLSPSSRGSQCHSPEGATSFEPREKLRKGNRNQRQDGRRRSSQPRDRVNRLVPNQEVIRKKSSRKKGARRRTEQRRRQNVIRHLISQESPPTQHLATQPATSPQISINQDNHPEPMQFDSEYGVSQYSRGSSLRLSDSALRLVRLVNKDEIKVFQWTVSGLKSRWITQSWPRESISLKISELGAQLGDLVFYLPEGRTISQHELDKHETICIAPHSITVPQSAFPAEEEL
ncbi:hypothetical protein FOMG_15996 [Fusarium oxysporum f. sp. melonis 26406]|uniref:Uncharacterized protein n=1 Tax=Fusarium oxysporum f. sp. melonis 26406 TaxID=1089452 RepID=W9ZGM8_FUSOX|nr:hypothetical protein FOMG_15996 [Fusarium oxysporum f. sp. melonis 26406]